MAIEGAKGAGKTTVMTALRRKLAEAGGGDAVLTKEPTARFSPGLESHLLGMDLATAIAQDRAVHVDEVIRPALDAGKTVICDRYILSSLVFHSTDGVPEEEIWLLNQSFPLPDANLVLSASADVIRMRRHQRPALTRLEAASTPDAEYGRYVQYGQRMESRGVALKTLPSETLNDLELTLEWIMRSIRYGVSP